MYVKEKRYICQSSTNWQIATDKTVIFPVVALNKLYEDADYEDTASHEGLASPSSPRTCIIIKWLVRDVS
jgi:hypothetical protein